MCLIIFTLFNSYLFICSCDDFLYVFDDFVCEQRLRMTFLDFDSAPANEIARVLRMYQEHISKSGQVLYLPEIILKKFLLFPNGLLR